MAVVWGRLWVGLLVALIIVILVFPCLYPTVHAQSEKQVAFTSNDWFTVSDLNSSIRFANNGSCSSVTLASGIWTFTNLKLGSSQTGANLSIGAKNSNITIFSLRTYNFSGRSTFIRYTAEGAGSQTIKLDLNSSRQTKSSEWSVTIPGDSGTIWLAEGQNWNLQPDNTVIVSGLVGNVSLSHYSFVSTASDGNHSILILTATVLVAVLAVTSIIRVKVGGLKG